MNTECRTCCIERVRHVSDTELSPKSKPEAVQRSEVFTGAGRRRTWTTEQKAQIVAESYESGEPVSAVARADCPAAIRLALRSTAAGGRGCRRERVGLCAGDRGSNFAMRGGTGCISGARRAVTDGRDLASPPSLTAVLRAVRRRHDRRPGRRAMIAGPAASDHQRFFRGFSAGVGSLYDTNGPSYEQEATRRQQCVVSAKVYAA
jgi:hypothetical protein